MCRMLAAFSAASCSYADLLLDVPNCLLSQSGGDHRGEKHDDGWGLVWYEADQPRRVRAPTAARNDPQFVETARLCASTAVVAHVRQASVGELNAANAHPFVYDRWTFAHNGTIERFDVVREQMVAEMDDEWRGLVEGTTDSEWLFYFLLARGTRAGLDWSTASAADPEVVELVRHALREVAQWSEASVQPGSNAPTAHDVLPPVHIPENRVAKRATCGVEPTRLNLLLTNGTSLLATRWKYDLCYAESERGVMVASESIGAGSWREMPEPSILTVSRDLRLVLHPLAYD